MQHPDHEATPGWRIYGGGLDILQGGGAYAWVALAHMVAAVCRQQAAAAAAARRRFKFNHKSSGKFKKWGEVRGALRQPQAPLLIHPPNGSKNLNACTKMPFRTKIFFRFAWQHVKNTVKNKTSEPKMGFKLGCYD